PDYFAFFEDVDLGWRLWLLGYRVTLTPSAITYHRHHGTAGAMPGHRTLLLYERNALYTIYKNYDEGNLDKILPAALLLLGQRAARYMELGGVDFAGGHGPGPSGDRRPETGDRPWSPVPGLRSTVASAASKEHVHRLAVASLLAADEFRANLGLFRGKREWLQARRVRSDADILALFGQ